MWHYRHVDTTPAASSAETVEAILSRSGRRGRGVPVRRSFLQQQESASGAPLAQIVRNRDDKALDLLLLHRVVASAAPWDVTKDARVWARALGLVTPTSDGAETISRIWRRLDENYHLVKRERRGRLAKVTALMEDGSGQEYTYPSTRYFRLPFEYWTASEEWHRSLPLPAKSMLLVALSLKQPFVLPVRFAKPWYGISEDTAGKGLSILCDRGLLSRWYEKKRAPLAPLGYTQETNYRLRPPFDRPAKDTSAARGSLRVAS
jgi:hypothetical protein